MLLRRYSIVLAGIPLRTLRAMLHVVGLIVSIGVVYILHRVLFPRLAADLKPSSDYHKPLAAQQVGRLTLLAFVMEEVVVGKVHRQADSLETDGQEKVIDCHSVGSWLGNRSLHVADFLWIVVSAIQFANNIAGSMSCLVELCRQHPIAWHSVSSSHRTCWNQHDRCAGIEETFALTQAIVSHRDRAWARGPPHRIECFAEVGVETLECGLWCSSSRRGRPRNV